MSRTTRSRRRALRVVGAVTGIAVGAVATLGINAAGGETRDPGRVRSAPVIVEPALVAASEKVQAREEFERAVFERAVFDLAVLSRAAAEKAAQDSIWDRIAACETQGDWSMRGSSYSGGVGFSNAAWDEWGGRQFAPNAGQATREEQIVVAERIRASVGLGAWGCAKTLGLTRR
jgi:Transglycosylase-like domain